MNCPQCSHENPNDSMFCRNCGTPLTQTALNEISGDDQLTGDSETALTPTSSSVIAEAKGKNGTVQLLVDRIQIKREGWRNKGKGDTDVPLSQISSLHYRDATRLVNGYLQLIYPGGSAPVKGNLDAVNNGDTVIFGHGEQKDFEALKLAIDQRVPTGADGFQVPFERSEPLDTSSSPMDAASQSTIAKYSVKYLGGHPAYPSEKAASIDLLLLGDRFSLQPTSTSKKWFADLDIPYDHVTELQIVDREVGGFAQLMAGRNSQNLVQANNIHIHYGEGDDEILLRLEMISGITVMGQAKKCRELGDKLRTNRIRQKFASSPAAPTSNMQAPMDIPEQIEKLARLKEAGILSTEEFEAKKGELLSRL